MVQVAFSVLVIASVTWYLLRLDWASLRGLHLSWAPFTAATLLALTYRYWGALVWLFLLRRLGATGLGRERRELCYVYAKAWLGRYVLGAGTWILGKVYFASRHGISRAKLGVSGLLEAVLQLIATLLVGLGLLALDPRLDALGSGPTVLSAVAAAVCLVALVPGVFRRLLDLTLRLLRRGPLATEDAPTWTSVLGGGALYVSGTLLTGTSYFLIARAVYPDLAWADLGYVVGSASIAAAVSMLAVFAPGGLGVREGVQVVFLTALMPMEAAVVVTVLTRLWSVLVDLVFLACTAAFRDRRRTGTDRESVPTVDALGGAR